MAKWKKIAHIVDTGEKNEYSVCPVLRYVSPDYYVIYLHAAVPGRSGWVSFLSRSNDLIHWKLSTFNPILEAEPGEGINHSDVDLVEYRGNTFIYDATGDQETWGTVHIAMYAGPLREFFE